MKLTLRQRLELTLRGFTFSHKQVLREGAAPTPFYIAKCRIHGYYVDYPHGFEGKLRCLLCMEAEGR